SYSAAGGRRLQARTRYPAAASVRVTCPPTKPPAPVTSTGHPTGNGSVALMSWPGKRRGAGAVEQRDGLRQGGRSPGSVLGHEGLLETSLRPSAFRVVRRQPVVGPVLRAERPEHVQGRVGAELGTNPLVVATVEPLTDPGADVATDRVRDA